MNFEWQIQSRLDIFKLTGIAYLLSLLFNPLFASINLNQDSLFKKAEQLKVELLTATDSSEAKRVAFRDELAAIIELSSQRDAKTYTTALFRCVNTVRDLPASYEFLELILESAKRWETDDQRIGEHFDVYLVLARVSAGLQDHKSAYFYLDKISELPSDSLTSEQLSKYYFHRGYLAYFAGENEKAASLFAMSSEYSLQCDNQRLKSVSHNAWAHCLNLEGAYAQGREVATNAFSLFEVSADSTMWRPVLASLYMNLAEAQHGLGEKKIAYENISKALRFAEDSKYDEVIGNAHWIWSRLLRRDNRLEEAICQATEALKFYRLEKDLHSMLLALDELKKTTKAMKDYESSLVYTERYHHLKDSLNSLRLYIESRSAEFTRKSQRQQAELALLKEKSARQDAEVSRQKIERLGLSVLVFILCLGIALFYWRLREKKSIQAMLQLEVQRRTEALKLQAERLKVSNEELERFAYIASHDLKTPIRNIVSFLGLIKRKLSVSQDAALLEFIHIASDNAKHMHSLISGILEFSRLNAKAEISCELFDLGSEVEQLKKKLPADGVEILVSGTSRINAPKTMVLQVVQNIIENGIKYNESADVKINVAIEEVDGVTTCEIRDNGIGIDPQYSDRIFEMFKRLHTPDQYDGTGLGLAFCKKITSSIGGDIAVDSAVGQGSIFTVTFPSNCAANIEEFKRSREMLVPLN